MWECLSGSISDKVSIVFSTFCILFYLLDWRHMLKFMRLSRWAVRPLEYLFKGVISLLIHWMPLIVQPCWRRQGYFTRNHIELVVFELFLIRRSKLANLMFENSHCLLVGRQFFASPGHSTHREVSWVKFGSKRWLNSWHFSLNTWIIFENCIVTRNIRDFLGRLFCIKFW